MHSITVIISISKFTRTLNECLKSLASQTLPNVNVCCFVSNITKLKQIQLERIVNNNPTVKFIICNNNFSKAFNDNISGFDTEYIMFANQSNIFEEDFCDKLYNQIKNNNSDIGIFGSKSKKGDIGSLQIKALSECIKIKDIDILNYQRFLTNKIYNLDFIKRNNLNLSEAKDLTSDSVFNLRCMLNNAKYSVINLYLLDKKDPHSYSTNNLKAEYKSYREFFLSNDFNNLDDKNKEFVVEKICKDIIFIARNIKNIFTYLDLFITYKKYLELMKAFFEDNIFAKGTKSMRTEPLRGYFFELFFSLKNKYIEKRKYKELRILGIKAYWKCNTKTENTLKTLLKSEGKENKIVIIEANNCHGENIPTFLKYLKELGYSVDLIITKKVHKENPMYNISKDLISECYILEPADIGIFVSSNKIKEYDYCILTSQILYYGFLANTPLSFFDVFENYKKPKYGYIVMEHHLDRINKDLLLENRVLGITDFNNPNNSLPFVNTNYFGDFKIRKNKNKLTTFISVGAIEGYRRNCSLLVEAVEELVKTGITNFKVIVVGAGKIEYLPDNIKNHFEILGRVSYKTLFEKIQQADYFLSLLDPTNIEHERYIKYGTSGSFNLIYGFNKPCIIAEKFANVHHFNTQNSIIYTYNNELKNKMLEAINQSDEEYTKMCESLSETVENINKKSFDNLKSILIDKKGRI